MAQSTDLIHPSRGNVRDDRRDIGLLIGVANGDREVVFTPSADRHILIAGGARGGKSMVLRNLADSARAAGHRVIFITPTISQQPGQRTGAGPGELVGILTDLVAEIHATSGLLRSNGAADIGALPETLRPDPIFLAIDNFDDILTENTHGTPSRNSRGAQRRINNQLANTARAKTLQRLSHLTHVAQSVGITIALVVDKLTPERTRKLPGGDAFKSDLTRLLLGPATASERKGALRQRTPAPIITSADPHGYGAYETRDGNLALIRVDALTTIPPEASPA